MNEPVTSWPLPAVVDRVFHQRLAEPRGDRAVELAFHDHGSSARPQSSTAV